VPYCQSEADAAVDWRSFVAFAQRRSNGFVRARLTQMLGMTVPGELEGIGQPLSDGASVDFADKMVDFGYGLDPKNLAASNNRACDPAQETRVLTPFLHKAKRALETRIDAVVVADGSGTFGVSLAVAAKRFGVPPPRAYDLVYEVPRVTARPSCWNRRYGYRLLWPILRHSGYASKPRFMLLKFVGDTRALNRHRFWPSSAIIL
jgi:hypothetical protein